MTTSSTSLSTPGFDNLSRTVWGMFFGEEIHSLREQKELSIEETACRAGMTVPQWEAIETGRVPRRWEQICAMADGLKEKPLYGGFPGDPLCGGLGGRARSSRRDYATGLISVYCSPPAPIDNSVEPAPDPTGSSHLKGYRIPRIQQAEPINNLVSGLRTPTSK